MHHHENESWSTRERKKSRPPQKFYPFWLTVYLSYWFVIQNIQVSFFTNGNLQPTPFLFTSNTPSLTLLICCCCSLSLSTLPAPHSVFTSCHFDINTLIILYALSLNKLNWMKTVFHLGDRSQWNCSYLGQFCKKIMLHSGKNLYDVLIVWA